MAEKVVKRPLIGKSITKLSDDILIEIFLKLPVRTVLSLRSVSKHWLNIIQNPNFIKLHFNRPVDSKTQNPLLVLRTVKTKQKPRTLNPTLYSTKKVITFLCDGDKTLDDYRDEVDLESILPNSTGFGIGVEEVRLMEPCNGLFCVTDTVDVVLFNLATRQCRKLPPSHDSDPFECVGFGYDSISDDYKVVKFNEIILDPNDNIDHDDNDDDDNDDDDDDDENSGDANDVVHAVEDVDYDIKMDGFSLYVYKVEIFSLSTKCWREVESVVPVANMDGLFRCNVFVNGAFHWLQGYNSNSILVFDLNKEIFKQFELPEENTNYTSFKVNLSVFNEYLAMILYGLNGFHIWVMMEYGVNKSWKKIYATRAVRNIDRPLSFCKDEEFLLQNIGGELVSFDLITKTIKEIEVQGEILEPVYAFRYRETLVSL